MRRFYLPPFSTNTVLFSSLQTRHFRRAVPSHITACSSTVSELQQHQYQGRRFFLATEVGTSTPPNTNKTQIKSNMSATVPSANTSSLADLPMPTPLTPEVAEALLKDVDYVLFDVDGVIWSGDHVFYQVPEMISWLAFSMGKKVRFMTNNATRTRAATKDEFVHKGFPFVTDDMVYSSAYVAALELKSRWRARREGETRAALDSIPNPFGSPTSAGAAGGDHQQKGAAAAPTATNANSIDANLLARQESISRLESDRFPYNVFVIGEKGLHDELRDVALAPDAMTVGLELSSIDPTSEYPLLRTTNYPSVLKAVHEAIIPVGVRVLHNGAAVVGCSANGAVRLESLDSLNCGAVIVGLDRSLNMLKTSLASLVLQRAEKLAGSGKANPCDFIATNEDPSITIGAEGYHFPGAGSCVAMLKMACGRDPDYVCGKPHPLMAKVFMDNEGVADPSRCLMIGDRLTTDIAFGRAMGARTLMVLTGAETLKDVAAAPEHIRPEFVAQSAASLMYTATGDE